MNSLKFSLLFLIFSSINTWAQKPDPVTITFERLATLKPSFLYEKNERLYFQNDNGGFFIAQKMSSYYEDQVYKKPEFIPQKDSLGREYKTLEDFIHSQLGIIDTSKLSSINLRLTHEVKTDSTSQGFSFQLSTENDKYPYQTEVLKKIISIFENKKYWSPACFDTLKVKCNTSHEFKLYCTAEEIEKLKSKPEKADSISDVITYPSISQLPEFPGGKNAQVEYLTQSLYGIKKPSEYEKNNQCLKIHVSFIVEKDGRISEVVLRRAEELNYPDQLKIINAFLDMPNWNPGRIDGEPKRLRCATALKF